LERKREFGTFETVVDFEARRRIAISSQSVERERGEKVQGLQFCNYNTHTRTTILQLPGSREFIILLLRSRLPACHCAP